MKATNEELEGIPTKGELLETALAFAKQAEARALRNFKENKSAANLGLTETIRDLIVFIKLAQ